MNQHKKLLRALQTLGAAAERNRAEAGRLARLADRQECTLNLAVGALYGLLDTARKPGRCRRLAARNDGVWRKCFVPPEGSCKCHGIK